MNVDCFYEYIVYTTNLVGGGSEGGRIPPPLAICTCKIMANDDYNYAQMYTAYTYVY